MTPNPQPLLHGRHYHIYNRGVNRGSIFFEPRNYTYFMELYIRYVAPIADTLAYCLLGNHFHLLVKIKDKSEFVGPLAKYANKSVSQYFSNLFNAYARTINMTYNRSGALFQRPFGRIEVTNDSHLTQLIIYIHRNPEKHGLIDDFRLWPYSSFSHLLNTKPTRLKRSEVVDLFGGIIGIELAHKQKLDQEALSLLVGEDQT